MNDSPQHPDLDALLHRWAERHQTQRDREALEQQIVDTWLHEQDPAQRPTPASKPILAGHSLRQGLVWFALGAAAALIAVFLYPRPIGQPDILPPPTDAWIRVGQQSEKLELVQEMERLFENRLAWIAETPDGVQLEIRDQGMVGHGTAATLAVRVVVARRTPNRPQWTPIWTADLMAREEQAIQFVPSPGQAGAGSEFSLWAYRVDDDVIAVDSDLSLGNLAHHCTFHGAQISGIPTSVNSFQRDGTEYRVFQTVAILDREA